MRLTLNRIETLINDPWFHLYQSDADSMHHSEDMDDEWVEWLQPMESTLDLATEAIDKNA